MATPTINPALRARTGTPVLPSPHPKLSVTLEEWEEKAPLSELEIQSIKFIQKSCEDKPLPLKATPENDGELQSSTTLINGESASRSGTPVPGNKQNLSLHPMHPRHPIQTTQQFYDWFSTVEGFVAQSQEAHFHEHLQRVVKHTETCDDLLANVTELQEQVDGMLDGWQIVESGGKSLKDACELLLDERDSLSRLADDISVRLEYFQELEHATRMLNHPGDSLVVQADFLDMVERVDICIDFLQSHRNYHEAEIYLLRFNQCLTRAMTLIKIYFVSSLKSLTADISSRLFDRDISQTAQMHLLYTRFQSFSAQVASLLAELERRTLAHPDELTSLLGECHSAYFSARRSLLVRRLLEEIRGLDPSGADLVELTRSGCSYLKQVCIDEFAIFKCFFNSGQDPFYQYLESLCDYLYDDLRPRILHEPRLSVLCGVCRVLQALMVLDVPEIEAEAESDDEDRSSNSQVPTYKVRQGLGKLHISHLLRGVLQDAQTRLFFKAQTVIQAEIRYYVPKTEDLDYPEKLIGASVSVDMPALTEKEEEDPLFRFSSVGKRESWYPTVKMMISVLSQLHDFIELSIFNDIAHEAIESCRISLNAASNMILAKQTPPGTAVDSDLFLVRHILLLKELTNKLDLVNHDVDGAPELPQITDSLKDMLRSTSLMSQVFASGLARLREEPIGAGVKEGIDDDLRKSCEHVIDFYADLALKPILTFMARFYVSSASGKPTQDTASITRDNAVDIDEEFSRSLKKELTEANTHLRLYLDGSGTVSILLSHIQDKIVDTYVAFRKAAEILPVQNQRGFITSPDGIRNFIRTLS